MSSLHGIVTDPQGAVVPVAVVTLSSPTTGASRNVATDDTGSYQFSQMPPGEYTLTVSKPGFSKATRDHVTLQVSVPATLDVQLEVATTGELVSVVAEAALVSTTDASMGNAFTENQVRQLPLDTRNVVQLLSLQPGVTPTGEVLGARRDQNNVTLDGVDVNDNQTSTGFQAALPVPLDSVQEFRTTVAGQGADQGRSSGGQVSLVTKSGSNSYHGSVYEYGRWKMFAANNWFSNRAGVPRENLIRNQYGASFGGRIIRDRAFFFLNWEDRKD